MKYFIASDLHGDAGCIKKMLKRFEAEGADTLLLLGDYLYHGPRNGIPDDYDTQASAELLNKYASRIVAIAGNCDAEVDQMLLGFPITSSFMIFPTEPDKSGNRVRVVAQHGQWSPGELHLEKGDVYLHGHTHVLCAQMTTGGYFEVNPGSVSLPKGGNPKSYAIWEGRTIAIKKLEDGEMIKGLVF